MEQVTRNGKVRQSARVVIRALLAIGSIYVVLLVNKNVQPRPIYVEVRPEAPAAVHPATVMQEDLYAHITNAVNVPPVTEKVYGGIISHHFYMEEDLSNFFLSLRNQKPSVVVLLGPNHFNAGTGDILLSKGAYNTPFGQLNPATTLANKLLGAGVAAQEESPFDREHSIATPASFVKKVFPDAEVLPIIIRRGTSIARTQALAGELQNILPDDALVLASVDFSHHLDRFAAEFHDAQSVAALQNGDVERIRSLEVDSPQSLEVLVRYLQTRGAQHMEYVNTNQALYSGNLLSDDVTSYTFARFTKGAVAQSAVFTFMHFGSFDAKLLLKDEGAALYELGGPERNLLRGADLKVLGVEGLSDCGVGNISSALKYQIQVLRAGKCADITPATATEQNAVISFIRVGKIQPKEVMAWLKQDVARQFVVAQVMSVSQARLAIDAGAAAAFVQGSAPKVEIYKSKPIISLTRPGQAGFSTGIVFDGAGEGGHLYFFPYQYKNGTLYRPDISTRLAFCQRLLPGFKADGCRVSF